MEGSSAHRSSPSTPAQKSIEDHDELEVIATSELQKWMSTIEQHLHQVCTIAMDGKLNSDQKLKINNHCLKVTHGIGQMAVLYQSLKQKAIHAYSSLHEQTVKQDLVQSLSEIKQTIQETTTKQDQKNTSFADIVKKGPNSFIRPIHQSSVAIYPNDVTKSSEDTKQIVQQIIRPEEMKLKVRAVRKTRNGGVIISTETKEDVEKLKRTVQHSTTGLTADEVQKRKPRVSIIGVPTDLTESDVFKCVYEQNLAEKLQDMSRDTFMTSIKLSHKSGKKDAAHCNYVVEVPAAVRKALISLDRLYVNWTCCRVRDFTLVTRCYKCHLYGHAAKTCKAILPTCGHCGAEGHGIQDCSLTSEPAKCATCLRFKKPSNHKTGDVECPARKAAEYRFISSIDYEGA